MSTLEVNKLAPLADNGTVTLGDSGDTITIPTGAGLTVTDEVKTNKISPATGTAFTLGDSGDTFTIPSGATITNNGTATGFGGDNTPSFHVYASSGQTVSANAQTKVVFNTEVIDTDNAFTTNTFTVPSGKGGKYLMYATVHNSNRSPSRYHVQIRQNNSEKLTLELGSTGLYAGATVSGLVNASAGDTFDVYYYNNAASNMTIDGGISKMFFGGYKLV